MVHRHCKCITKYPLLLCPSFSNYPFTGFVFPAVTPLSPTSMITPSQPLRSHSYQQYIYLGPSTNTSSPTQTPTNLFHFLQWKQLVPPHFFVTNYVCIMYYFSRCQVVWSCSFSGKLSGFAERTELSFMKAQWW